MFLLFQSDFLRFLITNDTYKTWEETALSWALAIIVVAVIWTILWTLIKLGIKFSAAHAKDVVWRRTSVWGYIFLGLIPVTLSLFSLWYYNEDFLKVAYINGLLKGVIITWILYFIFTVLVHLVIASWRREL